jgi:competence protein ComEC
MANPSPEHEPKRSPFRGFLPFFWLALACLGGILLADLVSIPFWVWLAGAVLSLAALLLAWRLPGAWVITHRLRALTGHGQRLPRAVLLVALCLGGWRYTTTRPVVSPEHAAYYNDRGSVELVGTVVRPPDYRDNFTNLEVEVESLRLLTGEQQPITPEAITGRVLIQMHPGSEWAYGIRLRVIGPLRTPPERADFSFQVYLARQGIRSLMTQPQVDRIEFNPGNPLKASIFSLHSRAYAVLQELFPSPESDLLAGILLGRDQGLSPGLQDAFRRTGTTHIIAISGFNIAILAGLLSGVFTRLLGRKWGALAAIGAISAYTVFVGGDAAVTRAAIMGALGVMGGMFGRRQNGLNSLGLAVLGMALVNPDIPWDIGFQLSVAATLGLVLYAQPLEEWFVRQAARKLPEERAQKLVGPVSEFFLFTLAAQVMTLPIMIYHFGGVSWVTLVANPLILPVQSLVMVLGGLALLAGLVLPGLGQALALISLPFVRYTINMVTWLARLPGSDLVLPDFHGLWLAGFYAMLFFLTLTPRDSRRVVYRKLVSFQAGALVLAGLAVFTWNRVLSAPDGLLHLTLLDSAGTVLVETPGGQSILIGGGPSPSALNHALGRMLPAGDLHLDLVIAGSTAREDLLGLTGAVKKYPIEQVLWGVDPDANQTSRTVYALLAENGVPRAPLQAGEALDAGNGLRIDILWAGERGAVLWLTWDDFSALIPTGKVGDHWLDVPSPPHVLFLPDGLNAENLPLDRINLWSPAAIVFPVGSADLPLMGEHPVIALLDGYPLVSSQAHGWIEVSTDGHQAWVRAEK